MGCFHSVIKRRKKKPKRSDNVAVAVIPEEKSEISVKHQVEEEFDRTETAESSSDIPKISCADTEEKQEQEVIITELISEGSSDDGIIFSAKTAISQEEELENLDGTEISPFKEEEDAMTDDSSSILSISDIIIELNEEETGREEECEDQTVESLVVTGLSTVDSNIPGVSDAPQRIIRESRLIHSIKVTGEDFNFGPVLGKGSYGKVYLAKFAKTDQIVAVKTFKKKEILKDLDCLIPERNILKLAQTEQQPFVVNIFAAFQTEYHACLAMDFAPGGDLNQQLSKRRFSEPTVVFYSACIVAGLQFLHDHDIIHRDMKLDNVLLDEHGYAKIADFSLGKEGVPYGRKLLTRCGTAYYMAPEILQRQGYNRAVDWWAVGVMIYRMLLRKFPFGGILRSTIFGRITHQEPTFPKHLSHNAVDITSNLLDKNPSSRLGSSIRGAEDVKMSPFFKVCLCFRHLKTHCHDKK
ncbi:hypothetical protein XENTR_v10002991 [Xenopus tropicalis]|nr:hypothetical protein XENTR_v10002991 [Xenopus tropicalis]